MKKYVALLLLLLSAAAFCGCEKQASPPPPAEEAPVSLPEPEAVPEWEVFPGTAIILDGHRLPSGSLWINGAPYLRLDELVEALDAEHVYYRSFRWQETIITLKPDSRQVMFLEEKRSDFLAAPVLMANDRLYVPLELCQMLGMGFYEDEQQNLLYITPGAGSYAIPEGYPVPTLMYHAVSDDMWGFPELFVSPAELEAQLQYLTENGFTTIHFSDLRVIDRIENPVLLTFDDGYLDNYTELFPLLQKYNCKATIFVITDSIGTHEHYMTWEQAREMADSGLVSIQSHTATHPDLDWRTREQQQEELTRSYEAIFEHLDREPYVLCYPTGRYNSDTLSLMEDTYRFGLKMAGNDYVTGEDPLQIDRWYVPRGLAPGTFMDMVQ